METCENEQIEIRMLLEAIHLKYGYDFRGYSTASITRRVRKRLSECGLDNVSMLQHAMLNDASIFEGLLMDFSVNVTEMFRDSEFFLAVRNQVLPQLADLPHLKIWHAGCSTGEEVYSMAIMLHELGIAHKAQIYATDLNEVVLQKAREGIYSIAQVNNYETNYQRAGGGDSFSSYYTARYDSAIMKSALKKNIVFADHNLATDGVFGEMNLVMCRNVLIYFTRQLQDRAFKLFSDSLCESGFLCLGSKETLHFAECSRDFVAFNEREKIYRKATMNPSALHLRDI
jgi:chemotaxis protein methyltransferase CheR